MTIRTKKDAIKFLRDYVRGRTYSEGFVFRGFFTGHLPSDPQYGATVEKKITLFEKNKTVRYHVEGEFRSVKHELKNPVKWVYGNRKVINKALQSEVK